MLDTQSVIKNGMVINHIQKATWIPHFYQAPHYMVKRVIEIDFILIFLRFQSMFDPLNKSKKSIQPCCTNNTYKRGRLLSKLLAMYAQKGILLTVSAMIGKAVSGSQRRQFVVSIATSQLGAQSQAGETRLRRGSRIAISQN